MEDFVRKLALWHTKTFRPITTHDELEPILTSLGFIGLPPTLPTAVTVAGDTASGSWKEYHFLAGVCLNPSTTEPLPRPRLPYPRTDGLHVSTYLLFFEALSFYLGECVVADHFHVRAMPLHRVHDRQYKKKFRFMSEEDMFLVHREGIIDSQATKKLSTADNNDISCNKVFSTKSHNKNIIIHSESGVTPIGPIVLLKDLV